MKKLFIVALLFLAGCGKNEKLKTALDEHIQAYVDQGLFSGSVLIAKDGKILLCKGYGMANYELDVPNTPKTKFRLGSITKQFTSMAIMQLQGKELLTINDPLSKYIPDYPHGDKITIYHLLTHTAGIPNFTGFTEYEHEKVQPHTITQTIEIFKHKQLEFEPGAKFAYSNSGYVLLAYIIGKASGKTYETVLKENILDPLYMKNTGYDHANLILKNSASGYSMIDNKLVNASYIDMSVPSGAGGLYSTVEDLYRWNQALYTQKLLSQPLLDKIFTPCKDKYGCGWFIGTSFNYKHIEHGGGIDGFATDISRYPDSQLCIIALSNFDHARVHDLTQGLAAIAFGEKYELPKKHIAIVVNPEIYNQYIGKYRLREDFIITISREANNLFTQATGQSKFQMFPESETRFFLKAFNLQVSFIKDKYGKVTRLIENQGGHDQVAEKIE